MASTCLLVVCTVWVPQCQVAVMLWLACFVEDLLNNSICQSSCDSLLNSSCVGSIVSKDQKSRTVTVQRAISEPSKKFDQLRLQVRRAAPGDPNHIPRRAVSDETVDDHDYENVAIIRKTLAIQAANRRSQSSAVHLSHSKSSLSSDAGSSLQICPAVTPPQSSHPTRKLSVSSVNKLNSPSPQSRYSLISTSPSMEQLLIDYTPPPSYNEVHARQREVILAASRNNSDDLTPTQGLQLTGQTSIPKPTSHSASNSLTTDSAPPKYIQKRQSSMPNGECDAASSHSTSPVVSLAKENEWKQVSKSNQHRENVNANISVISCPLRNITSGIYLTNYIVEAS